MQTLTHWHGQGLFIVLAFSALTVTAGEPPSIDLELTMEMQPRLAPPGASGVISVTLTNHGPEPTSTIPYPFGDPSFPDAELTFSVSMWSPIQFQGLGPGGCHVWPHPDINPSPYIISFPALAVGETYSCQMTFVVSSWLEHQVFGTWTVGSYGDQDIDPSNNAVSMGFGQPLAVPAITPWAMGWLMMALVALALFKLSRPMTRRRGRTAVRTR